MPNTMSKSEAIVWLKEVSRMSMPKPVYKALQIAISCIRKVQKMEDTR